MTVGKRYEEEMSGGTWGGAGRGDEMVAVRKTQGEGMRWLKIERARGRGWGGGLVAVGEGMEFSLLCGFFFFFQFFT